MCKRNLLRTPVPDPHPLALTERAEACFTWDSVRVRVQRTFANGQYRLGLNLESFEVVPYGCYVKSIFDVADKSVHVGACCAPPPPHCPQ